MKFLIMFLLLVSSTVFANPTRVKVSDKSGDVKYQGQFDDEASAQAWIKKKSSFWSSMGADTIVTEDITTEMAAKAQAKAQDAADIAMIATLGAKTSTLTGSEQDTLLKALARQKGK